MSNWITLNAFDENGRVTKSDSYKTEQEAKDRATKLGGDAFYIDHSTVNVDVSGLVADLVNKTVTVDTVERDHKEAVEKWHFAMSKSDSGMSRAREDMLDHLEFDHDQLPDSETAQKRAAKRLLRSQKPT